ncbi:MAG: HlyC/CorC family transporter [Abditibacteriota bacterium]|nr:HlyC/CorC family transporter [Abditibacteriota bacterium]
MLLLILLFGWARIIFSAMALLPNSDEPDSRQILSCRLACCVCDAVVFALLGGIVFSFTGNSFSVPGLVAAAVLLIGAAVLAVFIFGILVPEAAMGDKTEAALKRLSPLMAVTVFLSRPALALGTFITGRLSEVMGFDRKHSIRHKVNTSTEIILETTDDDIRDIESDEKEMLTSVIDFNKNVVRRVMVPRNEMNCVSDQTTLEELITVIRETGHSRIPIYKEDIDHIVGIVHAKSMLDFVIDTDAPFDIYKCMQPVLFVPETKEAHELLDEFRRQSKPMAIVTDEYGGTSGLITVEDLLEEIVGDIGDEYDKDNDDTGEEPVFPDGGPIVVDASDSIDETNDRYSLSLPLSDEYNSVAGLVLEQYGDIPEGGESVSVEGYIIKVLEVREGQIMTLEIQERSDDGDK